MIIEPKFLTIADNFQCQEDLILWNILCNNSGKKLSADFSCLFTFFKKFFLSFLSFGSTGKISLKIADYGEFSILRNFLLGATPPKIVDENFVNLKIHHNQLFVMKYSLWYQNLKKINFFLKNVNKQLKSADNFFPQLLHKKFH